MLSLPTRRFLLVFLLIVAILAVLLLTRPVPQERIQEKRLSKVSTVTLQRMDLQPRSLISGSLQPVRSARMHFQVTGQVTERLVEPGQAVKSGQVLLKLDDADYQDALVRAEAEYAQVLASLKRDKAILQLADKNSELASREFRRMQKLGKDSLASKSILEKAQQEMLRLELDEAKLQYSLDTAQSRIKKSKSALDRAQRNLQRTSLLAPFDGIVNRVNLEVGDQSSLSQQAAVSQLGVEIIDISQLTMYAEVASESAAVLQLGQNITLDIGGASVEGRLASLQIDPDPVTFTHPIEIRINGERFLPGMLARANIMLRPVHQVLVAPFSAVLRDEGQAYVFIVRKERLVKVPVKIGVRSHQWLQISGDLQAGEQLVASDVAALSDGQPVIIRQQ